VRALFDFDGALQDIRNLDNISFSEWFIGKVISNNFLKFSHLTVTSLYNYRAAREGR
jgi:hypothetical protein